jgi:hypothetical protein
MEFSFLVFNVLVGGCRGGGGLLRSEVSVLSLPCLLGQPFLHEKSWTLHLTTSETKIEENK